MLSEFFLYIMQATFHRADRDFKLSGNILLRQIFEEKQI